MDRLSMNPDNREYKRHLRKSGLDMPDSLNGFYAIAGCNELELDCRNFEISAAECLAHWIGHYQGKLFRAVYPSEDYFEKLTADALKDSKTDMGNVFRVMLESEELQSRLGQRMYEFQLGGNKDDLVETFNATMKFYREMLIPQCRDICKITADYVNKNKEESIKKIREMQEKAARVL